VQLQFAFKYLKQYCQIVVFNTFTHTTVQLKCQSKECGKRKSKNMICQCAEWNAIWGNKGRI